MEEVFFHDGDNRYGDYRDNDDDEDDLPPLELDPAFAQEQSEYEDDEEDDQEDGPGPMDQGDDSEGLLIGQPPFIFPPPRIIEPENNDSDERPTVAEPEEQPRRGRRRPREDDDEEGQYREYEDREVDVMKLQRSHDVQALLDEHFFEDDDNNEPEEHVAGMILPHAELSDLRVYYRELFRVTCRMGTETTRLLKQIIVDKIPLSDDDRALCNAWVKYWTSYMVENHYTILGKLLVLPTGPGGASQKCSGTMAIIVELWRLKVILNHHRLGELRTWKIRDSPFLVKWLLDTPGVQLDAPPIKPDAPSTKNGRIPSVDEVDKYETAMAKYNAELEEFERSRKVADIPVLALKQSQIRHLVQYITGRIRIIPYGEDIRKLIELVEIKIGIFLCQTLPGTQLDDPRFRTDYQAALNNVMDGIRKDAAARAQTVREEYQDAVRDAILASRVSDNLRAKGEGDKFHANRDFWYYCCCYMYPLTRMMYYAEILPLLRLERFDNLSSYLPEGSRDRLENWIRTLAKRQGDKYYDRLADTAEDALSYPGDMDWLAYRYPEESTNIEVVLRKVRGEHAYLDQHATKGLSQTAILDMVNRHWLATEFVIEIFDRYLHTHKGASWAESYLIRNSYIDDPETTEKWKRMKEPFLVQVFSNYWLMIENKVLPVNDIYMAICLWMHMLRKTREVAMVPKDCLNDRTYIGDIIDTILLGKNDEGCKGDPEKEEQYMDSLRRQVDIHTTRIPI